MQPLDTGGVEPADDNRIQYLARLNFRNQRTPFGIKRGDRLSHMYVIGKTGTGKSTLLETLVRQDIANGEGFALIDPHGDLVERIAQAIPENRREDVIYFNVPDDAQPFGYNPLKFVREDRRALAASGFLETFKKMWEDAWGVRMEHILRNALLALLDQPDASMPDILRLMTDRAFRRAVAANVRHPQVKQFWLKEFEQYSFRYRADGIAPIQNKVGAFLADPRILRILTAPKRSLHFRRIMDRGKVLLVNLSKGRIGDDAASLLGGLLVTTLGLAAFSRADTPERDRRNFYFYVDEFQSFTTLSVANMLSELRKYRVGLVLAHQYLFQLDLAIRHAVLGNAGTIVSFRLGPMDAAVFAREFEPKFETVDLLNLPNHHIYLKLMIDGAPSQPFSAVTFPPSELAYLKDEPVPIIPKGSGAGWRNGWTE